MFIVLSSLLSHYESSVGSFDECRLSIKQLPNPQTKSTNLGCESACRLPPFTPTVATHPKGWYSFYRPTEGRRLSWTRCLVTDRDGLPACRWSPIKVLTGLDIEQDQLAIAKLHHHVMSKKLWYFYSALRSMTHKALESQNLDQSNKNVFTLDGIAVLYYEISGGRMEDSFTDVVQRQKLKFLL